MKDIYDRPMNRQPCACLSWTTASGELTPIQIKVKDESGEIQTIKNIEVLSTEKKSTFHCNVWIFHCAAPINNIRHRFMVSYQSDKGTWDIVKE